MYYVHKGKGVLLGDEWILEIDNNYTISIA